MYKRMLVPLDGSTLAEVLVEYATKLTSVMGIEAIVLNVLGPEEKALLPMHQAYVERAAEKIVAASGDRPVKAWGEVVIGNPVESIKKYARKNNIDFVLMATHGRSGFSRIVMGSVADALLRESHIPIWLIRAGIPEKKVKDTSREGRVMLLLDGSKKAEASLPHVEELAKQLGPEFTDVVLVSVCSQPEVASDYPSDMPMSWDEHVAAEQERCQLDTSSYLKETASRLEQKGVKASYEVLMGNPAAEIVDYANRNNFSLIVMATHGRSGFSRWAFGSVAEKVLMGVTTPILLVRTK